VKGTYVTPHRTRVSPDALRDALRASLASRGVNADAHTLNALVAMSAHETGRWASCWNYNLGNVKASPSWGGLYTCLSNVWEVINGVTRWFSPKGETGGKNGPHVGPVYSLPPGHPQTRFRAYATLTDGVDGFAEKMCGMYRKSLDVLLAGGSTDAFLASLKAQRYFTGDLVKYQASVRSYYREFSAPATPDLTTVAGVQRALALLGYAPGPADGVAGPKTQSAIVNFQRSRALETDGVVGPITRRALTKALGEIHQ
jgi:hypothetical protein